VGAQGLLSRVLTVGEWNIGVVSASLEEYVHSSAGPATDALQSAVRWLPKPWFVRFRADPCLVERKGRYFLYFEEVFFGSNKGRLRFVELDSGGNPVGSYRTMIGLTEHASYPYVFEYGGQFHCVPETGKSRRVVLFKSEWPECPWKRHSVLLDGVAARDSTIFSFNDRWWLFCTVPGPGDQSQFSALHIWHAPDPYGPWEPHRLQPAKVDVHSARPAGRPFIMNGGLFRPAQDCGARYGCQAVINRVLTLTPDDFAEEVFSWMPPDSAGPYAEGLHTVTSAGTLLAIDGYRDRVSANPFKIVTSLVGEARERFASALGKV
jgi:hypothetical protein